MRKSFFVGARLAAVVGLVVHCTAHVSWAAKPATPPAASPQLQAAEQFVKAALIAEACGDVKHREENLKQALEAAPDLAAAHWHLGHVQHEGRWLPVDEAEREVAVAGKMAEYRNLRDAVPAPTFDDHIRLARWASKAGLKEQKRAHYTFALQMQNDCAEAIAKLKLVRFQGELMTESEYESCQARLKRSTEHKSLWNPRFQKLRARFEQYPNQREAVLSELRSLYDITALSSMEQILLSGNKNLALAVVDVIKENRHQAASESLARVAVFNNKLEVREAASKALHYRPRHSYIPILLAGLRMPITTEFAPYGQEGFEKIGRLVLCQELPAVGRSEFAVQDVTVFFIRPSDVVENDFKKLAFAMNSQNTARNERIFRVLAAATGENVESNANEWWNWWYVTNEYHVASSKSDDPIYYELPPTSIHVSCFVRGTLVWTPTGSVPIEKIKPGESVLAQNPETGELNYQPVLATTRRPTSPVLKIRLGSTEIRSTRGHPFWVSGIGWQMAKELKAGQQLHAVDGTRSIDSIEPTDEDDCFNLIVADAHNYFISDAKVLVHDNTLRGPLVARVPGLVE